MFYEIEYPQVYSAQSLDFKILSEPIKWPKLLLSNFSQSLIYNLLFKKRDIRSAHRHLETKIIKIKDGSEIIIGYSNSLSAPKAVALYFHTVAGNYTQNCQILHELESMNIAFVSYTRSGNDSSLEFSNFNFVGLEDELFRVIDFIKTIYPLCPIHAIGSSAGAALIMRYLANYNQLKTIKSAVLISPGYNYQESFRRMSKFTQSYLLNKLKYTVRNLPYKRQLNSIHTLSDWIKFQSALLGYKTHYDFILHHDPHFLIDRISIPIVCISALDDPIFSGEITKKYCNAFRQNSNITIVTTKKGGHVRFIDSPNKLPWSLRFTKEWLIHITNI